MDSAAESIPEIVHTRDGSHVVRELIVRGNAKVGFSDSQTCYG